MFKTAKYNHPKIKICKRCNGYGVEKVYVEKDKDFTESAMCKQCNGTGKVFKSSIKVTTIEPYTASVFHQIVLDEAVLVNYSSTLSNGANGTH